MDVESHCLSCGVCLSLLLQYNEINTLVCAVCILGLCFPHPRKLSFSSAGVHIHFIIHFFITVEWPVMLMFAVVALWSADIAAVSVVTAALAAQARCSGTHKHFICILAPKC